jgi:hypothetical protein
VIDEAIGKILGMAMAYLVSVMGLFLAYVNYRKRIVKAERVMSPTAWLVVIVSILLVAGGVAVVAQLTGAAATPDTGVEPMEVAVAPEPAQAASGQPGFAPPTAPEDRPRSRWPWIGIVVPAAIFLFATIVTAALHRHFSTHSPGH